MTENKKNELLVISNHPPEKWSEEQKKGWDIIDFIPFPNVPPDYSFDEVTEMCLHVLLNAEKWLDNHKDGKISIQGEFTLTSILLHEINMYYGWIFTFPTTERIMEEKDGIKTSTFKFVRWR